jgi:5'-3' exonuclease
LDPFCTPILPSLIGLSCLSLVKVLKVEDAEADDVIATLTEQAVKKGVRVVVASPDMDYRQLLTHNVKMVLPLPEMGRWSFYTLQQYVAEHECDPSADLGLSKLNPAPP